MRRLGLDIGSLSLHAVVLEEESVQERATVEHAGRIEAAVADLLSRPQFGRFDTAGVSSSLAGAASNAIDATLATIEGARRLLPGCRSLIAMGGQSFSLVLLDPDGRYVEHTSNPPCASGTGSFLEQQAERLGLDVRELARRAGHHTGPAPRIASRCAVFAKTDITHAMQEGHSLDAVAAGLCEGMARSMLDVLRKGRTLTPPVGLLGGMARNATIAASIEGILGVPVIVPTDCHLAGAIGAALLGTDRAPDAVSRRCSVSRQARAVRPVLSRALGDFPSGDGMRRELRGEVECLFPREAPAPGGRYLGIDIGSTSTKAVLTDAAGGFVGGWYGRTAGDPLGAVQALLRLIDEHAGSSTADRHLLGVATTGSGRTMIRQVFRADREINEITAHARAAVALHPGVDTILEIGGQDSKFTRLRDGEVYYSTMNYVCAAGTGSFIEEQAHRLGVSLEEFAEMAMSEPAPFTSDRCTVYMERDLAALLGEGWSRPALAAAVLHSVRDNYLSKVVGRSALGSTVVFQGATARNRALVSAFEQRLGITVHVASLCHLTGALGAALFCRDEGVHGSRFLWETEPLTREIEECRRCANHCALTVVDRHGERTGWGMKCGREYADRRAPGQDASGVSRLEDRYAAAMTPMDGARRSAAPSAAGRSRVTVGIPRGLYAASYEPLWRNFLRRLGFSVVSSAPENDALEQGAASVNSDFCAPMILAHGYVRQLLDRGVDWIFSPAVTAEREGPQPDTGGLRRRQEDSAFCYYSQYLPSIVAKLTAFDVSGRLVSPLLPLREKTDEQAADILHGALSARVPGLTVEEVRRAWSESLALFRSCRAALARALPEEAGALRVVLLGRPYVVFDPVMNAGLPLTLEQQGASVLWQEELPLEGTSTAYARQYEERMHWHYGKLIIRAAEFAARTENLYPVFLTCFRCSPDSFLMSYVKDIVTHYGKPFLFLQLDAHASDVGYLTRIQAALQSFRAHRSREIARALPTPVRSPVLRSDPATAARADSLAEGDTVLVPAIDTLISRFWGDVFVRAGHPVHLLESSASALSTGFRHASGGECTPLVSIVGAAIETLRRERLDPSRTFLFLPTAPFACNFPQFPVLADMAFRAEGIPGVKIGRISVMALADGLSPVLAAHIMECYVAAGVLYKLAARVRPYEQEPGATDRAAARSEELVRGAIRDGAELRTPVREAAELFRAVPRDESAGRKPRVALMGDLYVRYNAAVNEKVHALVEALGGELLVSSLSEYAAHLLDLGARRYGEDPRSGRLLRTIEGRFEKLAEDLIGDEAEPDVAECAALLERYGLSADIPGETSLNVGRALWYCAQGKVQAVVHVNPMLCCPGVVSASLFRKVQADFGVPIIDIFYDGAANPNHVLVPHLHYLRAAGRGAAAGLARP
ncbi:MAG TPA: acyl-CoA dehydratase activase [Spirochaetia bacterium]|nr:acyl-CoA dehydratase activase [Spirochaetia bacterium]